MAIRRQENNTQTGTAFFAAPYVDGPGSATQLRHAKRMTEKDRLGPPTTQKVFASGEDPLVLNMDPRAFKTICKCMITKISLSLHN